MSSKNIDDACKAIRDRWEEITNEFFKRQPGKYLVLTEVHRPVAQQFDLYKKGRKQLPTGVWVVEDKNLVVTNVDGYKTLGAHNYFPSRAIDVAIVDNQTGKTLWEENYYHCLVEISERVGLESGASWKSLKDPQHIQVKNYLSYYE